MVIIIILAALLSAWLYRLGGMSIDDKNKYWVWRWCPDWMCNTKARDMGCALVGVGLLMYAYGFSWAAGWKVALAYIVCFGGTFGGLTTYGDGIFGYDNFYFHGFLIGFAKIFFAIFGAATWVGWGVQLAVCSLGMGILCQLSGNDYVEELGRGAIKQLAKIPLLLIK